MTATAEPMATNIPSQSVTAGASAEGIGAGGNAPASNPNNDGRDDPAGNASRYFANVRHVHSITPNISNTETINAATNAMPMESKKPIPTWTISDAV